MALPKKGTLHQVLVPMVDATDFASIESAITESDFNSGVTKKFYGVNTGGSAATTSGTISKTGSLVRSGVFRLTLKTTENNYDQMMIRVNKTGCAEQIYVWENVDNDDSDIVSAIAIGNSRVLLVQSALSDLQSYVLVMSGVLSDVQSAVLVVQSAASDAASAAQQGSSRVLLVQSRLSDLDSRLVSDLSDLASAVAVGNSRALVVVSSTSDIYSRITSGVQINASSMSDLRSAIAGVTATLTASDISDIASAVRATLASDLSDIYSAVSNINSIAAASPTASDIASKVWADTVGAAAASRVLLILSRVSDVQSALTVVQSMASDAHSAAAQGSSRVLVVQSMVSDVRSQLTAGVDIGASSMSDIRSAVAALTVNLTASDISDIASAVAAAVTTITQSDISNIASAVYATMVSNLSDILSAAQQANSRVLVAQSGVSDIYSLVSDLSSRAGVTSGVVSDIYSLLQAGPEIGSSSMSDLRSAIVATAFDASDISDIASAVWATPGSDPAAVVSPTGSRGSKIDWLTGVARNRIEQTATKQTIFNDGGTAIASAMVSDDNTTFVRGEFA